MALAAKSLDALADLSVLPDRLEHDLEKARPASKQLAKQSMLFDRIVKKTVDDKGELISIEKFPFWTLRHSRLGEYGVNVAMQLLLSFQMECVGVFIVSVLGVPTRELLQRG